MTHTYWDVDGVDLADVAILDDPLERAAIVAHRLTFAGPEDVLGMTSSPSGRDALVYTWSRLGAADRHLYRRRAAAVLDAHAAAATAQRPAMPDARMDERSLA